MLCMGGIYISLFDCIEPWNGILFMQDETGTGWLAGTAPQEDHLNGWMSKAKYKLFTAQSYAELYPSKLLVHSIGFNLV